MARGRSFMQASRERPSTPTEPLPPGVDDGVPSPAVCRTLHSTVAARNASARDAVAGPGVDGAPPPALLFVTVTALASSRLLETLALELRIRPQVQILLK